MRKEEEFSEEMIKKTQDLKKAMLEFEVLLTPTIHVCTQSGKSIVPVVAFFVDGVGIDGYTVISAHKGYKSWNILGHYKTLERALQVYKEMLQCPKDEVYVMPAE